MSHLLDEILEFNENFVLNKEYEKFRTDKLPEKKLAVLTCMDTRLTGLLPAALGIKNGDVKLIKNAGAVISHPFGSVMRSLMVCIYEMGVQEIAVIGHYDCGMCAFSHETVTERMLRRGIPAERLRMLKYYGVNLEDWLKGFDDTTDSILETVKIIKNHPLVPEDVLVHGLIIEPTTGRLSRL